MFEKADSDIVDALVENSVNLPPAEVIATTGGTISAAQEIDLEARASSRLQLALDFNDGDLTVNASESRLFETELLQRRRLHSREAVRSRNNLQIKPCRLTRTLSGS